MPVIHIISTLGQILIINDTDSIRAALLQGNIYERLFSHSCFCMVGDGEAKTFSRSNKGLAGNKIKPGNRSDSDQKRVNHKIKVRVKLINI